MSLHVSNILFIILIVFSFSEEEKAKKDPKYYLNRANKDTLGILSELEKTYKEPVSYDCMLHFLIRN